MTASVAAVIGSVGITWSGLTVGFGILSAFLLSYSLYTAHSGRGRGMWLFLCFMILPAVVFSRVGYVLFHAVEFHGFFSALTDFSDGGFWFPGVILAAYPAALLVGKTALPDEPEELLDALAPGLAFFAGMARLSTVFGNTCRSMYHVTAPALRRFPFAVRMAASSGAGSWRFATFYMMALMSFALSIVSLVFYMTHHGDKMKKPCGRHGNVARLTFAVFCAVELVLDSTRADRTALSFRLLRFLNRQMREISVTQIFAVVSLLAVMLYYSSCAGRAREQSRRPRLIRWLLFGSGLVCAVAAEYLVQRYTAHALLLTLLLALAAGAMAAGVVLAYRACRAEEPSYS